MTIQRYPHVIDAQAVFDHEFSDLPGKLISWVRISWASRPRVELCLLGRIARVLWFALRKHGHGGLVRSHCFC